jgi:hypothetical protein
MPDSTLHQTTTSFHILPQSLFINHPTIRRCVIYATESVLNK